MDAITLLCTAERDAHATLNQCARATDAAFPALVHLPDDVARATLATALLLLAALDQADAAGVRLSECLRTVYLSN